MASCEELRQRIIEAKRASNNALTANARAENAALVGPYAEDDLAELRAAIQRAALEAREAGCNVDDLVGPVVDEN